MQSSANNYLKTIYELSYPQQKITNKALAAALNVAPGSVTEAVSKLVAKKLVVRQKYHAISLTETGYTQIQSLMFRYRLCEVWLANSLQLPLARIPKQAWLMAAIDDPTLLARLDAQLQHPVYSPFGGLLTLPAFNHQPTVTSLDTIKAGQTIKLIGYLEAEDTISYWQHSQLALQQTWRCVSQATTLPIITLADAHEQTVLINVAVARLIYVTVVA